MRVLRSSRGFSEFEFLALVVSGVLIAGLLAHFFFDQSIQVERLKVLVQRDVVRLKLETRLIDLNVLQKSAMELDDSGDNKVVRNCILGTVDGSKGCESRVRRAIPILMLGDDNRVIGGTVAAPGCLDFDGEPKAGDCFATTRVTIETLCANGAEMCRRANAIILRYQIQFTPEFLKSEPDVGTLERTVSLIIDQG